MKIDKYDNKTHQNTKSDFLFMRLFEDSCLRGRYFCSRTRFAIEESCDIRSVTDQSLVHLSPVCHEDEPRQDACHVGCVG